MAEVSKKVLAFGTYDLFHPGHEFFLKKCAELGELYVVVALDSTVKHLKGAAPKNPQEVRLAKLQSVSYVKEAVLGNEGDKYAVIEDIEPDIICLGYDQVSFTDHLEKALNERGLYPRIVRVEESHEPHRYKSSLLKGGQD
ncbi:adenylyltransferase/cytidyltransferase family protein [Nanoarchaeota archaeon]